MQAVVARHVLCPALLPGATGRADVHAQERAAVVAALATSLDEAIGPDRDPQDPAPSGSPVPVLVIAPARSSRIAVDAAPDLGALGLHSPPSSAGQAGAGSGRQGLDVTASVAVTLLRLAGWDGPVETAEVGGPGSAEETAALDAALDGRRLVVVALAAASPGLPAGARPDRASGQARVSALADRLAPVF